jgi:uncharacterized membrane protein/mono/diheme cytochrome c family protein
MIVYPTASGSFSMPWFSRLLRTIRPHRIGIVICALALSLCMPNRVLGEPLTQLGELDLPSQVRTIFSVKCAECHGAELSRPRGSFGYVTDLKRVANNPALVVPFQPAQSELWNLIRDDEMPPADAGAGTLSAEEKEVIRAWIEAGAPDSTSQQPSPAAPPPAAPIEHETTERRSRSMWERTLRLVGKLHVVVIHFPIALLVAAVIAEMWSVWRKKAAPSPVVRFCVLLGAAGAVQAAALGWIHAAFAAVGAGSTQTLAFHRWLGTAASLWAVGTFIASEREARRGVRSRLFRASLLVGAALIGAAAHLGGALVYGEHYFDW